MFGVRGSVFGAIAVAGSLAIASATLLAEPRLRPLADSALSDEHRALVSAYGGTFGTGADFRTLLIHPELVRGVLPFANYILSESTLTPRDREVLILRTAWLTQSRYLWAKHLPRARAAGLTDRDIEPLAAPTHLSTATVSDFVLLRAADELHEHSFVSVGTWQALASRYNVHQLMDATFTVAEMTMLADLMNSVRLEPEPGPVPVLPPPPARSATGRGHEPLALPRVEPVIQAQASPEIRQMLDPSGSGREIAAVYRTFARHPRLYVPRQILSEYIRTKSTLSPRIREMLILRIGWRCQSAYEWAAHAPAGRRAGLTNEQIRLLARSGYDGWSAADAAIVRAADELFDADTLSDATWKALDDQFDERQLLDVLITTGGYRMVSMVLNTFGVPAEPNSEAFPGP
jgi:alkylhydroperoxidase family enzyme